MNDEERTYVPVTNTYKINEHFIRCKDEPLIIQQGSQGASKTISDLMLIIDYFRNNPTKEITICSAEKTKLISTTFNDLKKICIDWDIWDEFSWNEVKSILRCKTSKTGFIEFIGLDVEDIGKGRRRDLVYINEVNKLSYKKFFDITQRAKKTIADYNPDNRFFIHDEINEINYIELTFDGNEKLPKEERRNIMNYKKKGYYLDENDNYILDENGNPKIRNKYYANKWQVYGLGQVGSVDGRILYWNKIPDKVFHELDVNSFYAVDWGKHDPFGIIEIKYLDGKLFLHELNYKSENEWALKLTDTEKMQIASRDEGFVTWLFQRIGISKDKLIVCDNNRPTKIIALRKAGWENTLAIQKVSGSIIDGIDILQGLDVYFTESSKNIDYEQRNYTWDKDKNGNSLDVPIDANNHTIDPARYGVLHLVKTNVIKRV